MVRFSRRCLTVLLALALIGSAKAATAAPTPQDDAQVQALVTKANAANAKGDVKTARDALIEAFAIEKLPALGVALAKFHMKLGELVEARAVLEDIAPPDANAKEPKKTLDQRAEAAQLLADVKPRIATIHIEGDPPSSTVTIDGNVLPPGTARLPLSLNPGHHVFDALVGGASAETVELDLADGVERTISFHIGGPPVAQASLPPPPVTSPITPNKKIAKRNQYAVTGGFGAGYVPKGVSGPDEGYGVTLELDAAAALPTGDVRLGVIGAYEATSYQSSVSAFLVARSNFYLADVFAMGLGLGLGAGSFSPKNGKNADNGGSGELLIYAVPALVRVGPKGVVELSLQGGLVGLLGFGFEIDPFAQVAVGFATW